MFTVEFGTRGLCRTIEDEIRSQVSSGKLMANERLPSKRALAEHLGVSVMTVQNAYSELIAEGYLYSVEKKGFFVTDLNTKERSKNAKENRETEKNPRNPEAIGENQEFLADFSRNQVPTGQFPFSLWSRTMRKILSTNDGRLLKKVDAKGVLELREAIAGYLLEFRNISTSPEQIVIGAGSESLCSMLVQILGREKIFAVENPGYRKIARLFEANGANCESVEIDENGMSARELSKSHALVAHISPAHHFPTGIVMPIRRRMELLSWAEERSGFIIEDEYDSEFRFDGRPLPPILNLAGGEKRVIYMNTFSKTLAPSFRMGFMVLPQCLLEQFDRKIAFNSCLVPAFEQFTLAQFIRGGFYGKHIIRMKNYYRNLRNALVGSINSSGIRKSASIGEENSGLHFLLELKNPGRIGEIRERLLRRKINIPLLSDFSYNGNYEKNSFVLNYSGIERAQIPEIVRRMEEAFDEN